jgi:hypothetical protein
LHLVGDLFEKRLCTQTAGKLAGMILLQRHMTCAGCALWIQLNWFIYRYQVIFKFETCDFRECSLILYSEQMSTTFTLLQSRYVFYACKVLIIRNAVLSVLNLIDNYENNEQGAQYRLHYYFRLVLHVSGDVFAH